MAPRVFIIHGWRGSPHNAWIPWLRTHLEELGAVVEVPPMPYPHWPVIRRWLARMHEVVGECDEETYFVGHSLGCQAILRYLEELPDGQRAGGAVFVGGFEKIGTSLFKKVEAYLAVGLWLYTPLRWEMLRTKAASYTAIFSDDDGWVSAENAHAFRKKLHAHVRMLHGYGHFTGSEGIFEVPELLDETRIMLQRPSAIREVPLRMPKHALLLA